MPPRTSLPGLRMAFYNLFMLASVVNPLIYVFTNDFYKKAFMEVFGLDGSDQGNLFRGIDNKTVRNRKFYFVYTILSRNISLMETFLLIVNFYLKKICSKY